MSQPGERRAGMEAWLRVGTAGLPRRHSPANAGQEWKLHDGSRGGEVQVFTARRSPGRNGSNHQTVNRATELARHSPANAGQEWKHHLGDVVHEGSLVSQPGERRAGMEARPAAARCRPGSPRHSPASAGQEQPGVRRARMEQRLGAAEERGDRRHSPASAAVAKCRFSQPGERRAGMEAGRSTASVGRPDRHSPANAGQEWKQPPDRQPRDRVGVTARRTPGRNGSRWIRGDAAGVDPSHSPANAGQEWKQSDLVGRWNRRAGHSPANAGQEWKPRWRRRCTRLRAASQPGQRPGRNGSDDRLTASITIQLASQPGHAGQEWKRRRDRRRAGPARVTARRTPGRNGSSRLTAPTVPPTQVTARRTPGRNGSGGTSKTRRSKMGVTVRQRRARMEATASGPGSPTTCGSQPGERRARMEARGWLGHCQCAAGVTARRTPGRNGSDIDFTPPTPTERVTARRTPGKNGRWDALQTAMGAHESHSPANAGQEWKHGQDRGASRRRHGRHSPANAGQNC